jgi:uncharacterized integral membrane protein
MQEEDKDIYFLPSRKRVHKTEKGKWTIVFYRILLILLILLIIGLGVWGMFYT